MKTNIRDIPYSARRYWISTNGTVYDKEGCEIKKTKNADGHYYVKLAWINGVAEYKVATLMLLTHVGNSLPDHLLEEIEPLYVDGDAENLSAANIFYKFRNGPIEVETFPGFYYVPLYANYAISKTGEIVNWKTRKYKTWSYTKPCIERNAKGGYAYNRVVGDDGGSRTLFRHRALCMTFLPYGQDMPFLVVNHKDGIPGNDDLPNLEWATCQENNIHAVKAGLRLDNKPVLSMDLRTGVVLRFSSTNECAKHYGHPQGSYIRDRILSGKVYSDLVVFKDDDGSAWPEIDLGTVKIHIAKHSNKIMARNVFTGDIIIFNGTGAGSEQTGVKPATILKHVKEEMEIPVNGWNFRYAHKEVRWPMHSKRHLMIYERYPVYPPDGLIIIEQSSGEETFFTSVADACQQLRISKHVIYKSIQNDCVSSNGKWKFKLFDIRKSLSHPTEKSV